MRRGGILAFVIYILALVASLGLIIYCRTYVPEEGADLGDAVVLAFIYVCSIFVATPSAVLFLLKLVNMLTCWKFFSVLCMLCEIAIVIVLTVSCIQHVEMAVVFLAPIPVLAIAFASELVGLRK